MKNSAAILLILSGLVFVAETASAGCTGQTIGETTYYNCDNGLSGTSRSIGGSTFYNYNDGTSGTSRSIGGTTFNNFNNPALRCLFHCTVLGVILLFPYPQELTHFRDILILLAELDRLL